MSGVGEPGPQSLLLILEQGGVGAPDGLRQHRAEQCHLCCMTFKAGLEKSQLPFDVRWQCLWGK